jgi:hypothetical protein
MDTNRLEAEIFEIDITVQNNTLTAGMNGGNIVAAPGDRVLWRTDPGGPPFTLEFFQLASEPSVAASTDAACINIDVAALSRWPFAEPPEPPGDVVGPTHAFAGVLSGNVAPASAFKYYVTVGNLRLDPIIIWKN